MKVSDEEPVRPAALVSLAVMVWAPCARPVGVNDPDAGGIGGGAAENGGAFGQRHRGIGVGGAGQRIVGGDVVGAGGMRQRFGHGRRGGVIGEGERG